MGRKDAQLPLSKPSPSPSPSPSTINAKETNRTTQAGHSIDNLVLVGGRCRPSVSAASTGRSLADAPSHLTTCPPTLTRSCCISSHITAAQRSTVTSPCNLPKSSRRSSFRAEHLWFEASHGYHLRAFPALVEFQTPGHTSTTSSDSLRSHGSDISHLSYTCRTTTPSTAAKQRITSSALRYGSDLFIPAHAASPS